MPQKIGSDCLGKKTKPANRRNSKEADARRQCAKAIAVLKENPQALDAETREQLSKLLSEAEESSGASNTDFSQKAKDYLLSLSEGASLSADLIQILCFLSGTSSLPLLFNAARVATGLAIKSKIKTPNKLCISSKPSESKRLPEDKMNIT